MDKKIIGARIKEKRVEFGFTLEDVAQELGLTKSTIQRYEKGTIQSLKLPVIEALARVLKVSPAWLCGKTDDVGNTSDNFDSLSSKPIELDNKDIAYILKDERIREGLSPEEVVCKLKDRGISISVKTLYGYEEGTSRPKLETFLALCSIYDITQILGALGFSYNDPERANVPIEDIDLRDALLDSFDLLNRDGRKMLVSYAEFLVTSGKYDRLMKGTGTDTGFSPVSAG